MRFGLLTIEVKSLTSDVSLLSWTFVCAFKPASEAPAYISKTHSETELLARNKDTKF